MRTGRTRHGAGAGLVIGSVLLGGGMLLAGCSAGTASSSSSSGSAAKSASGQAAGPPAGPAQAPAPAGSSAAAARSNPGNAGTTMRLAPATSIIYTAQLTVRAGDVSSAAAEAAGIADGAGGYVSSETTSADPDDPSQAAASVELKIRRRPAPRSTTSES